MTLSIIIVNYNVTDLLRQCLASIEKFVLQVKYEVIVMDNNSTDASWQILEKEFPDVQFLRSKINGGFAVANNAAIKFAKGNFLLLLNPDTAFEDDGMSKIIKFAESRKNFGCLGVRMHNAANVFLPESKRSVPNLINSFDKIFINFRNKNRKSYYRNDISETEISPVEVITGAFFLIKRSVYLKIGGLDERYFMYGEDIDICYTLIKQEYQNWYYGAMSILHHKGESTVRNKDYNDRFYGAMQLFVDKYYLKDKPFQHYWITLGLKIKQFTENRKYNQTNFHLKN